MRLRDWVKARGEGELTRLAREADVAYSTVCNICKGTTRLPRVSTAERLSAATWGAVTVEDLRSQPNGQ